MEGGSGSQAMVTRTRPKVSGPGVATLPTTHLELPPNIARIRIPDSDHQATTAPNEILTVWTEGDSHDHLSVLVVWSMWDELENENKCITAQNKSSLVEEYLKDAYSWEIPKHFARGAFNLANMVIARTVKVLAIRGHQDSSPGIHHLKFPLKAIAVSTRVA